MDMVLFGNVWHLDLFRNLAYEIEKFWRMKKEDVGSCLWVERHIALLFNWVGESIHGPLGLPLVRHIGPSGSG